MNPNKNQSEAVESNDVENEDKESEKIQIEAEESYNVEKEDKESDKVQHEAEESNTVESEDKDSENIQSEAAESKNVENEHKGVRDCPERSRRGDSFARVSYVLEGFPRGSHGAASSCREECRQ